MPRQAILREGGGGKMGNRGEGDPDPDPEGVFFGSGVESWGCGASRQRNNIPCKSGFRRQRCPPPHGALDSPAAPRDGVTALDGEDEGADGLLS